MGTGQVLWYAPNLVGYVRIILLLCALCTGSSHPGSTFALFLVNLFLDFVDGVLARALKQVIYGYHNEIMHEFRIRCNDITVDAHLCRRLPLELG